jgi:hypothetical protein
MKSFKTFKPVKSFQRWRSVQAAARCAIGEGGAAHGVAFFSHPHLDPPRFSHGCHSEAKPRNLALVYG